MTPKVNENSFTPIFLASLSVPELVVLQHELRTFPEDAENLRAVLAELKRRQDAMTAGREERG